MAVKRRIGGCGERPSAKAQAADWWLHDDDDDDEKLYCNHVERFDFLSESKERTKYHRRVEVAPL